MGLADILSKITSEGAQVLTKEPKDVNDALLRTLVVAGHCWLSGQEPLASELDRLSNLMRNKDDGIWRSIPSELHLPLRMYLSALRKIREEANGKASKESDSAIEAAGGSERPLGDNR